MFNPNFIFIRVMNSSLWIAVLVVHVGCIIEAQPSKSPTSSSLSSPASSFDEKRSHYSTFELVPAASISASYSRQLNYAKSNLVQRSYRGRKLMTSTTPTTSTISTSSSTEAYDDDSCTGKLDGYYQNFGSFCTSYYFCAAGYQITYVCPEGERFTGNKCDEEYECPLKKGRVNLCANSPNGYYSNVKSPGKYFYCFQRAKVIDLQCDYGKVFIGDKCTLPKEDDLHKELKSQAETDEEKGSCTTKSNGFYPDKQTGCKKYFYCINGEKTELSCQSGFLFNGDICVHNSRFTCPYLPTSLSTASTLTSETPGMLELGVNHTNKERPSNEISSVTDRIVQSSTTTLDTTTTEGSIRTG